MSSQEEIEDQQEESQVEDIQDNLEQDEDEEDDDGDDDIDVEEEERLIKEELKHASFETIMKFKQKQNEMERSDSQSNSKINRQNKLKQMRSQSAQDRNANSKSQEKRTKGAPMERNAKKPVSVFKNVMQSNKPKSRDPRFDGMSGTFNPTFYQNSYSFIDDMKKKEAQTLSKDIKKKKYTKEEKAILKNELGKIKGELKSKAYHDRKEEVISKYKNQVKDSIKQGALPFFAKKSQIKEDMLRMQFKTLQGQGKLENVLKKKRKQQSDKLMSAYHLVTNKKIKKE